MSRNLKPNEDFGQLESTTNDRSSHKPQVSWSISRFLVGLGWLRLN